MKFEKIDPPGKYKYILTEDYAVQTCIFPKRNIYHEFMTLTTHGSLRIRIWYAWDGMTCCPDFKTGLRGSLAHDVKYQLMRMGLLDRFWRKQADVELRQDCIEDGMGKMMAGVVYYAVRLFGGGCAK